jgi:hypothetical protein
MGIDESFRIDRLHGPGRVTKRPPEAAADGAGFRRLLEQLEQLAPAGDPPIVPDVDELQRAVRRADDDYRTAMDLRRLLEQAYRDKTS